MRNYDDFDSFGGDEFRKDDWSGRTRTRGSERESSAYNTRTPDFDTSELVKENGELLGGLVKAPPSVAGPARFLKDQFMPHIAGMIENSGGLAISRYLKKLGWSDTRAAKGGLIGASVAGGLTIGSEYVAGGIGILGSTLKSFSDVRQAVRPTLAAGGHDVTNIFAAARDNEVINNALYKIISSNTDRFVTLLAHGVSTAPQFMLMYNRHQERKAKWQDMHEAEMLKTGTPEQQKEYYRKRLKNYGALIEQEKAGFEKFLAEEKLECQKALKDYLANTKNQQRAVEELDREAKLLGTLPSGRHSGYQFGYEDYRESQLARQWQELNPRTPGTKRTHRVPSGLNPDQKDTRKHIIEEKCKELFAEEHPNKIFDLSFLPRSGKIRKAYTEGGEHRRKTLEEQHTEHFKETQKNIAEAERAMKLGGKDGKSWMEDNIVTQGMAAAGTVVGEIAGNIAHGLGIERNKGPIALDLILHMRRALEENDQRDSIPSYGGKGSEELSFTQYVHKIFQQHQHDCGKPEIGERYFSHLKEAGWRDEEIQRRDDKELTPYEVAVKHIAKRIQDGRMDALTLVNIVGERKVVAKSGKSFGTQGKNGGDEVVKEALLKEIDQKCALMKPHCAENAQDKRNDTDNLSNAQEEYRYAFSAQGLKGKERADLFLFLDMLVPDDKALRDLTGLHEKEIEALRKEVAGRTGKMLNAAVVGLSEEIEKNPQVIEKLVSKEEKEVVQNLAQEVDGGARDVESIASKEQQKTLATVAANAIMKDERYWRDQFEPVYKRMLEQQQEEKEQNTRHRYSDTIESKDITPAGIIHEQRKKSLMPDYRESGFSTPA